MDAATAVKKQTPQAALKARFGFDNFRGGQLEVVQALLAGEDVLAVMPTGAGKSMCFQLPACMIEGTALVISPLIALMKDQVDAMEQAGVAATQINSSVPYPEQVRRLERMIAGDYDIVYVAPERFRNAEFCRAVAQISVGLLAIDEAHCISQWGHDFRPDYLSLDAVREQLGFPPTIALTATATSQVQEDIVAQLDIPNARRVVSGFERPNLFYEVVEASGHEEKVTQIERLLHKRRGETVIIYCATRRQVTEVTESLKSHGWLAASYHAGLSDAARAEIQDGFMAGDLPILVATNAFGMGVDKSDVRTIYHYNLPGSLEAYYQEAGRAGRDGEPAECVLLYNRRDGRIHDFFTDNSFPERELVERVWLLLFKRGLGQHALSADQICDHLNRSGKSSRVHEWGISTVLQWLEEAGHLRSGFSGDGPQGAHAWVEVLDRARLGELRVDWERLERQRKLAKHQSAEMHKYATARGCRQTSLLRYFNSTPSYAGGCGHCDRCCGHLKVGRARGGRAQSEDSAETVIRKVLSGVARARQHATPIRVAAMLRGSTSPQLQRIGLNQVSTFGALSYLNQQDLFDLIGACAQAKLVAPAGAGRVDLSESGVSVMLGKSRAPVSLLQLLEPVGL